MKIGDRVRVVSRTDEFTVDESFLGRVGTVTGFDTDEGVSNTKQDPLIKVQFDEGDNYIFWTEELEVIG